MELLLPGPRVPLQGAEQKPTTSPCTSCCHTQHNCKPPSDKGRGMDLNCCPLVTSEISHLEAVLITN